MMNVVFDLNDETLYDTLINKANDEGIIGIQGHRSRGGLRASLYNAVSMKDVEALVDFLSDFENRIDDLEYKNNELEYRIDDIEYKLNM